MFEKKASAGSQMYNSKLIRSDPAAIQPVHSDAVARIQLVFPSVELCRRPVVPGRKQKLVQ